MYLRNFRRYFWSVVNMFWYPWKTKASTIKRARFWYLFVQTLSKWHILVWCRFPFNLIQCNLILVFLTVPQVYFLPVSLELDYYGTVGKLTRHCAKNLLQTASFPVVLPRCYLWSQYAVQRLYAKCESKFFNTIKWWKQNCKCQISCDIYFPHACVKRNS